jgi:hypothetical protein
MEWYIPISLLPGIALIILSTSNFILALNNEIKELICFFSVLFLISFAVRAIRIRDLHLKNL